MTSNALKRKKIFVIFLLRFNKNVINPVRLQQFAKKMLHYYYLSATFFDK